MLLPKERKSVDTKGMILWTFTSGKLLMFKIVAEKGGNE
jgi:hypothetical protein